MASASLRIELDFQPAMFFRQTIELLGEATRFNLRHRLFSLRIPELWTDGHYKSSRSNGQNSLRSPPT